jgi:hypothetical protein
MDICLNLSIVFCLCCVIFGVGLVEANDRDCTWGIQVCIGGMVLSFGLMMICLLNILWGV